MRELSRVTDSFFTGLKLVAYDSPSGVTPSTECPILWAKLSKWCSSLDEVDSSDLTYSFNADGTLTVKATDNTKRKVGDGYRFAVHAEAEGGSTYAAP